MGDRCAGNTCAAGTELVGDLCRCNVFQPVEIQKSGFCTLFAGMAGTNYYTKNV